MSEQGDLCYSVCPQRKLHRSKGGRGLGGGGGGEGEREEEVEENLLGKVEIRTRNSWHGQNMCGYIF